LDENLLPARESLWRWFCRAVIERSDRAWQTVVACCAHPSLAWLVRHPDAPSVRVDDDSDQWVDAVVARFWLAVKPERFNPTSSAICVQATPCIANARMR
jgi:hypothetical protein